ncbi:serine hydrolase domain-containing protein [Sphingomonas sp.]|jgi:CubicO group peptidase (beta-lactamase class C family)|uniref:serine hydrolase domain-containing protein n=1 Tax=Sphingomonas sp. TaxID=28214 RepID=UPI002DF5C0FF|nr:serine hydrolase domain-containing protein [Sphingomonas sp.]
MTRIRLLILAATAFLSACSSLPRPSPPSTAIRVTFDANRIASVEARGVGLNDPVRIASISKLIVAIGVMRLAEAGTLQLDADVSDRLGFKLRNPHFPDVPITLRLLLSHRSSLKDDVDYAIPLGRTVRDTLSDPKAWDAEHPPGTFFRYGNINFPVIASVMEQATGERFDLLMARLVFKPLQIDACFNWTTCSDAAVGRAIVLRDEKGGVRRDDLGGKRPDCPVLAPQGCDLSRYSLGSNGALFSPQGGTRISVAGLVRLGQLLLRDGEGQIGPESLETMIGPEWVYDGSNGDTEGGFWCAYGLAVQTLAASPACRNDPFGDGERRVGHSGEAYGLRSGLWVDRRRGRGVAYFVTAVPDDVEKGHSGFTRVEEAIAR